MEDTLIKEKDILITPLKEGIFNLLIATNDFNNLKKIKSTLKTNNYCLVDTESKDDILYMLNGKSQFDLLILDLDDKEQNYEVAKLVREKLSLFELPILIISDKNDSKNILNSFNSGANDYLSKPFNKDELLARVNTLLTLKLSVTNAIFTAKNYESEKQQRLFAETLSDLTRSLTSTLNMYDVLKKFLEYLQPFVKFDKSIILIKDNDDFKINITTGFNEEIEKIEIFANIIKLEVLNNGVFIDNNFNSKAKDIDIPLIGSLIGIPILLRNEIFGIVVLNNSVTNYYLDNEVGMLFSFAGQAGMALDNARLFEEVKKLATIDSLTKLYNRRYFYEIAEREFMESKRYDIPLSVIMVDIDNFKKINDNYGHNIGDEFIKYVAEKASKGVRKSDVICRYGGEEFVILLPGTDIDTAIIVAERIRKSIESNYIDTREFGKLFITSSLGVSSKKDETQSVEQLIHIADEALYTAKIKGRNQVCTP
ncbi:MAG TPA: diguanylate cyclase [Spirochaetota bacterium]|nr:diguanylate cyclase [Spirochaetota bacterium]